MRSSNPPLRRASLVTVLAFASAACNAFLGIEEIESEPLGLAELTVSAGELSPPFSPDVFAYEVILPLSADSIEVSARTSRADELLTISGTEIPLGDGSALASLELGPNAIAVSLMGLDDALTYTITARRGPGVELGAFLKDSTPQNGDRFGTRLIASGDTLAVVTGGNNEGGFGTASIAVFRREGNTWRLEDTIEPPCGNGNFGFFGDTAVDLDDDVLVVGLPFCAEGMAGELLGQVFVYRRLSNPVGGSAGWGLEQAIGAAQPANNDRFGELVAVSGDELYALGSDPNTNSNRLDRLTRTANQTGWARSGSSFVNRPHEMALEGGVLVLAVGESLDTLEDDTLFSQNLGFFATALAIDGGTLVVSNQADADGASGVAGPDPSAPARENSGATHVFRRAGNGWESEAFLKASTPDPNDRFGSSIDIDGDVLVVGAPGESSEAIGVGGDEASDQSRSSGAAYLFVRTSAGWSQQAYIKAPAADESDQFGGAVAVLGTSIAVAAPEEDSSGIEGDIRDNSLFGAGAVFVYE